MSTASEIAKGYFMPAQGSMTPAQLLDAATPRVVRALGQYDAAAPLIDAGIKYWWAIAIVAFGLGVAASLAGNIIYGKLRARGYNI